MVETNTVPLDRGFSLLIRNEMASEYDPLVRMIKWNIQTIINNYNHFREKKLPNPYPELKFDLFINEDKHLITKLDIKYPANTAYYNEYDRVCNEFNEKLNKEKSDKEILNTSYQKELTTLQAENKILKDKLELYKSVVDNKEPIDDNITFDELKERIYQDLKKEYSV